MTDRYFKNNFSDFNENQQENIFNSELKSKITKWIENQLKEIERNFHQIDQRDFSIYTGISGFALLYFRLSTIFPQEKNDFLSKAKNLIDSSLKKLDGRVITFLCGDPGPLAIAAVIYHHLDDEKTMKKCVEKIVSMKEKTLSRSNPDEYLYGRSGYLYTLMFLRREIGHFIIDDQLITEIFEKIIKSGEKYSLETKSNSPLMFQWYGSEYLGAAHGVSGIVYLLLRIIQHESFVHLRRFVDSHLIPTVEFLKSKRLSSGNYISSNDNHSDKLVQWCHGAPSFVYLFLRAFQVTGNNSYLERALSAGDVVWERGLLRKGYGLCHGASGNAYAFIYLYRITNDFKWLHRAIKFAEFCLDYGKHPLSRLPDCPFSLFEGLAGTIYFMADLLNPNTARFPGFE